MIHALPATEKNPNFDAAALQVVIDAAKKRKMRTILTSIAFVALSIQAAPKPNVILIMTDDQGYGDLSCHGHPWLKTPNLD